MFTLWPLVRTCVLSFSGNDIIGRSTLCVGTAQYGQLFSSPTLRDYIDRDRYSIADMDANILGYCAMDGRLYSMSGSISTPGTDPSPHKGEGESNR